MIWIRPAGNFSNYPANLKKKKQAKKEDILHGI